MIHLLQSGLNASDSGSYLPVLIQLFFAVVKYYKIISRSLVFKKFDVHFYNVLIISKVF